MMHYHPIAHVWKRDKFLCWEFTWPSSLENPSWAEQPLPSFHGNGQPGNLFVCDVCQPEENPGTLCLCCALLFGICLLNKFRFDLEFCLCEHSDYKVCHQWKIPEPLTGETWSLSQVWQGSCLDWSGIHLLFYAHPREIWIFKTHLSIIPMCVPGEKYNR